MSSKYRLVMRSGPTSGKSFLLENPEIFIGRDLSNDIVINDPEISRRHTRLFQQGMSYLVEDLGSTNGTFVNGQRLMGPYTLRPGELIMLGENISLMFEVVQTGPQDTMVSSSRMQPETFQAPPPFMEQPAPPPPPSAYTPAYTPAASAPPSQPRYAGQVPPSPVAGEPPAKKKIPTWMIIVGILLIISCFCISFLVYIDASNQWCSWFGWVFNMFSPGICP